MRNGRLFWNGVLLCLPTVAAIVAGIYFLVDKVPELIQSERMRVAQGYRELAVEAKEEERGVLFDFATSGFKRTNLRIKRESWGYQEGLVWYFKEGQSFKLAVEPVKETDIGRYAYPTGVSVLLLLVGLTVFGVWCFWKFVKARDDFLAAAAHDLTTPLVGMRRMIGRDDGEAKRLNERMILLVDNIKDFLKLGGRRKEPDLKAVDIVALTREAYSLFAADYADTEGGPVVFRSANPNNSNNPNNQTIPLALADEALVLQILWNLFGNDLKYAAPYGKVEVRFSSDEKNVTVEFVDEGSGMSPRQMRKAFDRYYRAKTVLVSGKGGFGIGLCTAREFARAMGGDLTVRPNAPRGCIFALRLKRSVVGPMSEIAEKMTRIGNEAPTLRTSSRMI